MSPAGVPDRIAPDGVAPRGRALKVLHLIAGELGGGAARGAYWLHQGLLELGVASQVLIDSPDTLADPTVTTVTRTPGQRVRQLVARRIAALPLKAYPKRRGLIFNTGFSGVDFTRHPAYLACDVVHLHWINGLVKLGTLRNVRKPLVWTLRDMWPLTGGCHYALECDRYRVGCGACPQLGSTSRNDLSRLVAHRKAGAIPAHAKLVGISDWLSDCARESAVTRHLSIRTISNNIDVRQFAPIEKATARRILGLPVDRRLVLLGAHAVGDFYKGFDLAKAALQGLRRDDVQLVFFGTASPSILEGIGHPTSSLGFLTDAVALRLAYSAADVFVAPSRMDAFGKTIGEAMACGTPAVCFDATGPRDIVEHRVSGWLARPFEVADLARGIEWVLDRPEADYARLCADARVRVVERFDTRVIARQYVALYDEALGAHA